MKQLYLNYRQSDQRKNSYQISFRNGETVSSDGFSESENKIQRTNLFYFIPYRAIRDNIVYFILLILQAFTSKNLYFIAILLVVQQWIIDLHNFLQIRNMDTKLKEQETRILKQWDECISNKEIITKIKERLNQHDQSEGLQRQKSKSNYLNGSQNKKQEFQSQIKKGMSRSIISNESIPFQTIQYKQQGSQKNIKPTDNNTKYNQMSPLIYQDMVIKMQQLQILETDPLIIQFKKKVPSMFLKEGVLTLSKIPLNEKLKRIEKDKMNLVKTLSVQDLIIGDVVILQRNEIAPCDILVLHCNDENFCVQPQLCDYSSTTVRKSVIQNRSDSQNLAQFKKSLTGNISITEQNQEIKGFFQLKKDPKSRIIGNENFIHCQEKLLATPWILGIVIKVGNNCRCYSQYLSNQYFENSQFLFFYLLIIIIVIIQIIVFNQNNQLIDLREISDYIIDNVIFLILILPHIYKIYYNLTSLVQLKGIGTKDQKQINSCHINNYIEKQYITLDIDSLIEQSFEMQTIIYQNKYCEFQEAKFFDFLTTACKMQNPLDSEQDEKQGSQVINYLLESSGSAEELFSQRECAANQIPRSVEGRFIHLYQQDYKEELNRAILDNDPKQQDKELYEVQEMSDHLTAQRGSHQAKNSKNISMTLKIEKQDKCVVTENEMYLIMKDQNFNEMNPLLLQLATNHLAFSKLLVTEKQEQKVKNKFLGQLDQKQVNLAKIMGYEFICVNNVQNQQHYIVQIHGVLHSFKLVDVKLQVQTQRLYMLFEMPESHAENDSQFILFLRESNVKKKDGIDDKVWKQQSEGVHYIYYSYCHLSAEEANVFLSTLHSNVADVQLYTLMEQLLKINIILGCKYILKSDCQEFMKSIRKSNYQLFLYTQNLEIYSQSILFQSELLNGTDLILHFNQDNEEDLRAYFKQSLDEFSNIFNYTNTNNQQQQIREITSHAISSKQMLTDQIDEKPKNKKVFILISDSTCSQIIENHYFKNHLRLLLSFTKGLFVYRATQNTLNIIQDIWCINSKTINLICENQSLLKCTQGQQIQILQLQQFSFNNQKFTKVDKTTFFKNMILSLKEKLVYEKCYFNELQISSNTDVVIQGFKELDTLIFFQSPLLKIFYRFLWYQTIERTLLFVAYFSFTTIYYTLYTLDQSDYTIEIVFFNYIFQFILYIIQHIQFIRRCKNLQNSQDQQLLLKNFIIQQESIELHVILYLKSLAQGVLISVIFYNILDQNCAYLSVFMVISIADWLYCVCDFNFKEAFLTCCCFPILFYFYIQIDQIQDDNEWSQYGSVQEIFTIILGICFLLLTNLLFVYIIDYNILPIVSEEFVSYVNFISLLIHPRQKRKNTSILQNKVNEFFDNIEQVDLSIQKLLLNQDNYESRFGLWKPHLFRKAQTILKWKQKQILKDLQLLLYHTSYLLILYFYQGDNYYFLIDYFISFGLQLIIFIIQFLFQLPAHHQEYLEYVQLFICTASTISVLFDIEVNEYGPSLLVQFFSIYILSIKFHPIYDFRIYLLACLSTIIGYLIWYIVEVHNETFFLVSVIQFVILFSIMEYFIKSYFIQLEENVAQNKLNFIEQNNKINDILGILLPKFIRDRLNETDQYNIHQNQGLVAILFCDICNFDQMVIEEQDNIINFLDDLFRTFDKYCQLYGVQKIETVGKTYLASAGLKACEQELTYLSQVDPVQRALNLAEQMMTYIRSKIWGIKGQSLVGKIGIHYGPAISGVIGFHKPQFSLIGDTVNTTSRHCSTGLEDKITLSEQAFDQIKNENIEFEIRQVEMKGLGVRPTYIFISKVQNKDNGFSIMDQDQQSKEARSNYVVRKNPEILKKNLKKRKTILTQINTMHQREDSIQDKGNQNVFGIKPSDQNYYNSNSNEDRSRHSIQLLSKQASEDKEAKLLQSRPSTFKRLVTMFQNKFQLENYEPEIDELIDYEQLLNVILLKNEYALETKLIKDTSFLQLLEISYYQNQMNQFINYDDYMQFVKQQSKFETNNNLRIFALYYLIKQFCLITLYNEYNIGLNVLEWVCCIFNFLQFVLNRIQFFEYWKAVINLLLFFEILICGLVIIIEENQYLKNIHIYEVVFIQSLFCSIQILSFWKKVLFCIITALYLVIMLGIDGDELISIFFILSSTVYNMVLILYIEQQQVGCFNQKNIFYGQQKKEGQLLEYLLPKHILNKFLDDKMINTGLCDKIDNLTILFADIAGFTEYSSKVTPEEVLVMLKNLFVEFDRKCYELKVYKLYTIGDCYVAVGMMDFNNRNPHQEAKNIIDLAFEMIKIIAQVRKQISFDNLNMRIGVHTGSVFGGVMGTDIVRYDVYGPDVLIANKMESNGVKGFVHISQETKKLLEQDYGDLFNFEPNTTIDLKTIKRKIEGYLVYKLEQDHFEDANDLNQ